MSQKCQRAIHIPWSLANQRAKAKERKKLFDILEPYAIAYANTITGKNNKRISKKELSKLALTLSFYKETKETPMNSFLSIREQIANNNQYKDVLSICLCTCWELIKKYKQKNTEFKSYFIRYFRWAIVRELNSLQNQNIPIPYKKNRLTNVQQEHIIFYSKYTPWKKYLFHLYFIKELTTRQISQLTGLSKSTISKEIMDLYAY